MDAISSTPREVALPASALPALRRALARDVDPLVVTHALHSAGFASGPELFSAFAGNRDPETLTDRPIHQFWSDLAGFFRRSGWGDLEHESPHPAVGLLRARNWAEAGEHGDEEFPGCAFSAGILASLLGEVAGDAIAVLEIQCRAMGSEECRFVYGHEGIIHELYGLLLEGMELEQALAAL